MVVRRGTAADREGTGTWTGCQRAEAVGSEGAGAEPDTMSGAQSGSGWILLG